MDKLSEFRQKMNKETKSGLISLLILYIIKHNKEPMYGYKIIQTIEELSNKELKFQEGTVYAILRSLQRQELLESYIEESTQGPPRKYYKITELGKEALVIGWEDWNNLVEASMRVINKLGGRS